MKTLTLCLLLVGVMWIVVVVWFYLISGIVLFLGLLVGPLALILGPGLVLVGWHTRLGIVITLIGSGLVTVYFAYALTELFSEPSTTRPSYIPYVLIGLATLACDIGAITLYRALFRLDVSG